MQPQYESAWDDLDTQVLQVDCGAELIRRKVSSGGLVDRERPELAPFSIDSLHTS